MPNKTGELQLLPETKKKIEFSAPGQSQLLVFAAVFFGLLLAGYGGLIYYNTVVLGKIDGVNAALDQVEKSRNRKDEDKLLKLKNDLAIVQPLLENHVYWSAAFERVQKLVQPAVQFNSLTVKLDRNEYAFKAVTGSYVTIAKQIAAFYTDDTITDVAVGKITSLPNGRIEFDVQLILDTEKVLKKNKNKP
ncbi:MAG: hypothetical protein AAB566_02560 [Patescibacteria group bacterium]